MGNAGLRPDSRLGFRPLSIINQGDAFIVGDSESGIFLALPEVGVVALRELQAGGTIAQATEAAAAHTGQDVDILDFAATMVEAGLVLLVDGSPVASATEDTRGRSWVEIVRPDLVRPLFSFQAWVVYASLFAFCAAAFLALPEYWPSFEDTFFYPDPAVSIAVMGVTNILLAMCHEVYHWLAARAAGVGARFNISRRLFVPVFETDLSQLWSVPRHKRYSPFLAGMAFDTMVLATCLGLRLLWGSGVLNLPPLAVRFLGAVVLVEVLALGWQALVFLRTDLYAVLVAALGCFNLYSVTYLYLLSRFYLLNASASAELANAPLQDLRVARWFGVLCLIGLAWSSYLFFSFFLPSTLLLAGWIFTTLPSTPIDTGAFWKALLIGSIATVEMLVPLAIFVWQRARGES